MLIVSLQLVSSAPLAQEDTTPAFDFDTTFEASFRQGDITFEYPSEWAEPIVLRNIPFITKRLAIELLSSQITIVEGSEIYAWTGYVNEETNEYGLMLVDDDDVVTWVTESTSLQTQPTIETNSLPTRFGDFDILSRSDLVRLIPELSEINFGLSDNPLRVISPREAAFVMPLLSYDPEVDAMVNTITEERWYAGWDGFQGAFFNADGEQLVHSFSYVNVIIAPELTQVVYQSNQPFDREVFDAEEFAGIVIHISLERAVATPEYETPEDLMRARWENRIDFFADDFEFDDTLETVVPRHILDVEYRSVLSEDTTPQTCRLLTVDTGQESLYANFNICAIEDNLENYTDVFSQLVRSTLVNGIALYE